MEQVRRQVNRVRRRLFMQMFGRVFAWTLFLFLCGAVLALAVPKLWALEVDPNTWQTAWLAGAAGLSLLVSIAITALIAPGPKDSAIVLDQRFGLKERLSSSLAMTDDELDTEIGQALLADASRRAEKIDVSEQFRFRASRIAMLPIIPVVFMAVLVFIPDAVQTNQAEAGVDSEAEKQIKTAALELKKKLELRRKRAEARGLKDAGDLFKKIESDLDELSKKSGVDQKKAMIALNNIKKQLQARRDEMGSKEELRKQMSNLKNIEKGPADKLARAMESGEMGKAQEEIKKLLSNMNNGMLTPEQQKQLEKQVAQMQQALQKAVDEHKKRKQELQQKMDQLQQQINEAKDSKQAEKLQKQMERMQQQMAEAESQDSQMQQMQQMAEGLNKAMQAMKSGDKQAASDALSELSDQLGEMQDEMDQLEAMMDQLSQTKQQMRCESCQGMGCKNCMGGNMFSQNMGGQGQGQGFGNGLGEGSGYGDRPEEEDDTNTYESQVRDRPKNGIGIASGFAGGPNRKGITREELQDVVLNALQDEKDPLEDRPLPRAERQHAESYFNQLRDLNE